jgi:hypothetical protein
MLTQLQSFTLEVCCSVQFLIVNAFSPHILNFSRLITIARGSHLLCPIQVTDF